MFFDRLMVSLPDGDGLFSFGSLLRRQKLMSNRLIKLSTRLGFVDLVKVFVFRFSDSALTLDRDLLDFLYVSVLMYRDFSLPLPKNGQPRKNGFWLKASKTFHRFIHYLSFRSACRWRSSICHHASFHRARSFSFSTWCKCCNQVVHQTTHPDGASR